MSFIINQNFDLKSPQFNFERDYFADLASLKAASESNFPDHFITNVKGVLFQLNKSNSEDSNTGKWRKFNNVDDAIHNRYIDIANINTYKGNRLNPSTVNVVRKITSEDYMLEGSLTIYQDSMNHVTYQELTTSTCPNITQDDTAQGTGIKLSTDPLILMQKNSNIKLSDGVHIDGLVYKYVRVYNNNASNLTSPAVGKWSDWKLVDWYDLRPDALPIRRSGVMAALTVGTHTAISNSEIDTLF